MRKSKQRLSQHFLTDPDSIRRIVDAAEIQQEDLVVEVGAGRGALTVLLVEGPGNLIGVELDSGLCDCLRSIFGGRLRVINEDVLKVDFRSLLPNNSSESMILVGNLPYHASGAIIEKILESREVLRREVIMVQKEVARRMTAPPGGKDYGILSVATQLHSLPVLLFDVPPTSFDPEPQVYSSVVRMDFDGEPRFRVRDEHMMFKVLRRVFTQRRKMIKNTLVSFFENDPEACRRALLLAGVNPNDRPETVSIPQYDSICGSLADFRGPMGGQAG